MRYLQEGTSKHAARSRSFPAQQSILPSSRGLTPSNDYDPYEPSRMSLHTIEIDWSQAYRPSTVVEDIPSRDFSGLEMQWAIIFDARRHRKPALPATWFEDDWEVAGVYPNHVLFVHKAEKKRAVQYLGDQDFAPRSQVRERRVELRWAVLARYEGRSFQSDRNFKAKNIQIRKWTSNNRGFCWVDSGGRFWQWSYGPSEEPEQVFTLHARAPRYWLTPITTPDGEWYAICATEKDRRRGVVHCFPSDHGEATIFDGPAAATFGFVGNLERRGGGANELAILLLSIVHDRDGSNIALEMRGLDRSSPLQRYGRSPISVAPSMKLLPELFVDPLSDLIIAGVSTAPAENSLTLIFDPLTGKYAGNKKLNLNAGDRVYCGACGLRMEQNVNVFRRLTIHPEGLPRPDSAGTGAAPIGSRRSFESWNSGDASSRHNRTGSVGGQYSSGGRSTVPRVDRKLGDPIGRAFAMGSAEDESWMYNR
ncbi:hypothetical protein FRC05_007135 [Tulasnella sp. 425]|nr:hypothetical protein FRC05_007135 [Tulasnella sp. 425]